MEIKRKYIAFRLGQLYIWTRFLKVSGRSRVQKKKTKDLIRGRSSVWLERLPVTQEVASSSLVGPAYKSLITLVIRLFYFTRFMNDSLCFPSVTNLGTFWAHFKCAKALFLKIMFTCQHEHYPKIMTEQVNLLGKVPSLHKQTLYDFSCIMLFM